MLLVQKYKIGLLVLVLSMGMVVQSFGQQFARYASYYQNPFLVNPAFAGDSVSKGFGLLHQNALVQFPGSPKSTGMIFSTDLPNKQMGAGFFLNQDQLNFMKMVQAKGTYAYRVNFNAKSYARLGISLGFLYQNIDFAKMNAQEESEPILHTAVDVRPKLDGDVGFSYVNQKFTFGISSHNIMRNSIQYMDGFGTSSFGFKALRTYQMFAMYRARISSDLELRPIVAFSATDGMRLNSRFEAQLILKENYLFGVNISPNRSVGITSGLQLHDNLNFNYSFETGTGDIPVGFTIHEVMLSFSIPNSRKEKSVPKKDSDELEERLDYLDDKTNDMNEELEKQKKKVNSHEQQLNNLKKAAVLDSAQLNAFIRNNNQLLQQSQSDNGTGTFASDPNNTEGTGQFYVIMGAFTQFESAKSYQAILKREIEGPNFVKRNKNGTFYLVYTQKFDNYQSALKEYKRLGTKYNGTKLVYDNVWIYTE